MKSGVAALCLVILTLSFFCHDLFFPSYADSEFFSYVWVVKGACVNAYPDWVKEGFDKFENFDSLFEERVSVIDEDCEGIGVSQWFYGVA